MYVTNMLQAVSGYDLKWEEYIGVAMWCASYNYMNFCDRYNRASLRLSRYAYYTVMYTACHNLMSNCPCKIHMTRYGLAYFSAIELV